MGEQTPLDSAGKWLRDTYEAAKKAGKEADINRDGKPDLDQLMSFAKKSGGSLGERADEMGKVLKETGSDIGKILKDVGGEVADVAGKATAEGGFLDKNKGAIGGALALGLIGMLTMGGGFMGLLMALVGLFAGAALMDGKNGMLGGLFGGGEDKKTQTPAGTAPAPDAPGNQQSQANQKAPSAEVSVVKEDGKTATIKVVDLTEINQGPTQNPPREVTYKGTIEGNDFRFTEVTLTFTRDGKLVTENVPIRNPELAVLKNVVKGGKIDSAAVLASPEVQSLFSRVETSAPAERTRIPPQTPEATPPQSAPPAQTAPQTPAATTQPNGNNAPLNALGPVVITGATAAAVTPNVNLKNPFADDGLNFIPATIRIPDNASAASIAEKKTEKSSDAGSNSYDIKTADGDIARSATFGITKNGRFVDPSKADVIVSGINNMDGTFTLTSAAARNERGEFPKIYPGSDQVMLATINGKSKDQLTIPAKDNKLNADEIKTKMALLVTASDEMSRQGAINAKAVEERNAKLDSITKEALERQVANANKNSSAKVVKSEPLPNGDQVHTFVQSGMLENGDRYTFKFQGRFETVPAENGLGSSTQRLIIDRGNFVDSPDDPIGSQSLINKDKPYVMSMTTLSDDRKTLVGDSRNLPYILDNTSPTTLSINYLSGLKEMSKSASAAPSTPTLQTANREAVR